MKFDSKLLSICKNNREFMIKGIDIKNPMIKSSSSNLSNNNKRI